MKLKEKRNVSEENHRDRFRERREAVGEVEVALVVVLIWGINAMSEKRALNSNGTGLEVD